MTDAQNGNEALGNVKSQEGLFLAMTYYKLAKGKGGHQAVSAYQDLGRHYFYYFSTRFLYSFETIHNIRIFEVEFSPCMANTMKNWNLSVQWWISTYVHRKLPFKNKNLR